MAEGTRLAIRIRSLWHAESMKRLAPITVLVLFVGLLGAAPSQGAKAPEIFRPQQQPLSSVKVVKTAAGFAQKMNRTRSATRNFLSFAARRTSKYVGRLNDVRKERAKERGEYLSDRITAFERQLDAPIEQRYQDGLAAAQRTYERAIRRINRGRGSKAKKARARAQANAALQIREGRLAQKRAVEIDRARRRVNRTRQANLDLYRRISSSEKLQVKRDKVNLREALSGLRKRSA